MRITELASEVTYCLRDWNRTAQAATPKRTSTVTFGAGSSKRRSHLRQAFAGLVASWIVDSGNQAVQLFASGLRLDRVGAAPALFGGGGWHFVSAGILLQTLVVILHRLLIVTLPEFDVGTI